MYVKETEGKYMYTTQENNFRGGGGGELERNNTKLNKTIQNIIDKR